MSDLADRFKAVFDALGTSPHKFHAMHAGRGVSRQTMFNLTDPTKEPGFDTISKVCELEPSISAEYLLRGIGDPIKQVYEIGDPDPCAKYKNHIRKQSQQNDDVLGE